MKKIFLIIIILFFMALMQIHSIAFWQNQTGGWGWLFSLSLEIAMLVFWYVNKPQLQTLKYLSAALLIAGACYQIASPLFKEIKNVSVIQAEISMTQDAIKQLSTSLERDEKKSDTRLGWDDHLKTTRADIKEYRAYLTSLRAKGGNKPQPWRSYFVAAIMSITLFITLTAQLTLLTSLRLCFVTVVTKNITAKRNEKRNGKMSEQSQIDYEKSVTLTAEKLVLLREEFGSQAKLCSAKRIRPEYVAAILNHDERIKEGGNTITAKSLQKVIGILGDV